MKDLKKQVNLKNIVAFCVLMENGDGIVDKAPSYILEKFNRYIGGENEDEWKWGLDTKNQLKLDLWAVRWRQNEEEN